MTLFARENELKSVCALLAPPGIGGALVLRGEAGVGKSALLNEAISAGKRAGLRILSTAGVSSQMQRPFAGLSHLMRSVVNDPALPDSYTDAWDTVRAAIGVQDAPVGNPFSVAYAALEVLSACSARQALLLIVDDAGWIDEQSWRVLSFIGRRIDFDKIALFMAMRDGVEADRRLRDSPLPTLRIEPLPDEAAAALLDRVAPAVHPRIRSWILLQAGGNPLGLLELADEAKRHGSAAMSGTPVALPARLEQTYAGLVSELPEATKALLLTAAFNDSHSLQETLDATAVAFDHRITLDELDPAISARLVSVEDGFELRFRHPLVCSALRQITSVSDRCRVHTAFAHVLRDEPKRSIWHRAAATVGKDDELAQELAAVARGERQRGDVAAAASTLERSAQLTVDASLGASRLLWAALSAAELGDADTVERLVRMAGGVRLSASAQARLAWLQDTYLAGPWSGSVRLRTLLNVVGEMHRADEVDLALDSLTVMSLRAWWSTPDPETRELIVGMAQRLDESLTDLRAVYVITVVAPLERGSWVVERLTDLAGAAETSPERLHLLAGAATNVGAVGLSNVLHAQAVAGLRRQGRMGTLARALAGQAWAAILLGNTRLALIAASEARAGGRNRIPELCPGS